MNFQQEIQGEEHLLELAHELAVLSRSSVDRGNVRQRHKHIDAGSDAVLWPRVLRVGRWDENQCVISHWRERVEHISGWPLCHGISMIIADTDQCLASLVENIEEVLLTQGDAHLEKVTSEGGSLVLVVGMYRPPRDSNLG